MINKEKFITRMLQHWEQKLNNVSNPSLKHTWGQIVDGFNDLIRNDSDDTRRSQWVALSPKTGTGKTQSLILYNVMLSEEYSAEDHPGTLVVTRLIKDANDISKQINDLSNKQVAISYHTETKSSYTVDDLEQSPVLVITHMAYLLAMDDAFRNDGATWERLSTYLNGTRKLVVIDEALDAVEEMRVELDELRHTHGSIPSLVYTQFPKERELIETLINRLDELYQSTTTGKHSDKIVDCLIDQCDFSIDLSGLREALANVRFDDHINKHDSAERKRIRMKHVDVLKNVESLLTTWMYYSKVQNRNTLNSSRLVVPKDFKGAVILDATASSDLIYKLFSDVQQVKPPKGARRYDNVTMKVSRGHKTGKGSMKKNAGDLCRELVNQLNEELPPNSKVLVVTHKAIEMILNTYNPNFEMKVAHWGAITGSNEYQDFDTVVLFGLPHRPPTWSINAFAAYQGSNVISDDWLQNKDARSFEGYDDIKSALVTSKLIVDAVQAINRIRCRKTIDEIGNCTSSTVYLMIPNDEKGSEIVTGIEKEMPGVNIIDWEYKDNLSKKKPRRSPAEESIRSFAMHAMKGRYSLSEVASMIKVSPRTVKTIASKLKGASSPLFESLSELGITYMVEPEGKTQRAYFVKS